MTQTAAPTHEALASCLSVVESALSDTLAVKSAALRLIQQRSHAAEDASFSAQPAFIASRFRFINPTPWDGSFFSTQDGIRPPPPSLPSEIPPHNPPTSPKSASFSSSSRSSSIDHRAWTKTDAERLRRGVALTRQRAKRQRRSSGVEAEAEVDWEEMARMYAAGRTALGCKNYYLERLECCTNRAAFSKREVERLEGILEAKERECLGWREVAERLNAANRENFVGDKKQIKLRTAWSCFKYALEKERKEKAKAKAWTHEEDSAMCKGVEVFGEHNWQDVAEYVGSRTAANCATRYKKTILSATRAKRWKPEEDARLRRAVEAYGEEWIRVCAHITDRTDVQCRERWRNLQDNRTVGHQTWTKREDDALRSLVKTHGKEKWKEVAKELERRALGESKRKGVYTAKECQDRYLELERAAKGVKVESGALPLDSSEKKSSRALNV